MLLCPVRQCHEPLAPPEAGARRLVCPRGHSFDIARSGYINLLQPQDRHSRQPGDSAAVIAARRRLHDRGVTAPLAQAISAMLAPSPSDIVLDAGCGDGFYLATLAEQYGFAGHGVDISAPAIQAAARRYRQCEWVVANADRFIPYADHSFSIILSITGRMNPGEFRRVLQDRARDKRQNKERNGGRLLVGLAAPDDLIELRRSKRGGNGRDRVARTIEEFAGHFRLIEQRRATTQADLDRRAVEDILLSIYRPMRREPIDAMRCTFSLDLLLFRPL